MTKILPFFIGALIVLLTNCGSAPPNQPQNFAPKIEFTHFDDQAQKELEKLFQENPNRKTLELIRTNLNQIPPQVFRFKNLESLFLYGNVITEIPKDIANLKNLKVLHIGKNPPIKTLPPEFATLIHLEEINLSSTCILEKPLLVLAKLPKLSRLDLKFCEIFPEIAELKNLVHLSVSGGGKMYNLKKSLETFSKLPRLEHLDLSGRNIENLPKEIGLLKNLKTLNLFHNNLESLPEEIQNLKKLETLYVNYSWNNINQPRGSFPKFLYKLPNLKELHLVSLFETLPDDLNQLKSIEHFSFTSPSLKKFPNSLFEIQNLKTLDLSNCDKLENLPKDLNNLKKLEVLHFAFNSNPSFQKDVIKRLSEVSLPNLKSLSLDGMKLVNKSGYGFLKRFPNLERLSLTDQGLKEIPQDVLSLKNLKFLSVAQNKIKHVSDDFLKIPRMHYHANPLEEETFQKLHKHYFINLYEK